MYPHFLSNWLLEDSFAVTRWVFLRLLAAIYLIAFLSLWVQVHGLIGERGILPVGAFLNSLRRRLPALYRYRTFPTVLWINASDKALHCVCALGVLFSLLLLCDFAPLLCLTVLLVCYLSLSAAGQTFLSFQWDTLLVETGFLAIFFAPPSWLPGAELSSPAPRIGLLLLWWLLFRLMFESGVVKLSFGDATWRNLTALDYHYYTQPLPTFIGWYLHHWPRWFRKASVAAVYITEIALPLLIFGPRECRYVACTGIVFLMILILATGNYCFFNPLTIALAALLLDDSVWRHILPQSLLPAGAPASAACEWQWLHVLLAAFVLLMSIPQLLRACFPSVRLPKALCLLVRELEPLRLVNGYGLFRSMTTRRAEIIIEGSQDGATWKEYRFRYRPGDVKKRPAFVEPHQPRLDWQMWFAALSYFHETLWFQCFLARLLTGSPDVLKLLAENPFPDQPPRFIRCAYYEYFFTSPAERKAAGAWWRRTYLGPYTPVLPCRPAGRDSE